MYHSTVISKMKENIKLCLEAQIFKEWKEYLNVNDIWEGNKDYERILRDMITSNAHVHNAIDNVSLTLVSLSMFGDSKLNVPLLSAFYRRRV